MTGETLIRQLLAHPVLANATVLAGRQDLGRGLRDVHWYAGDLDDAAGVLLICGQRHAAPAYRLDSLVRRAARARAAGLLIIPGRERPLLSSLRLADRLRVPLIWAAPADPVLLVPELIAAVRHPEQEQARAVSRLLRALSTKRTGAEILAAASTVLDSPIGLLTAEGATLLGPADQGTAGLRLDHPVAQHGDLCLAHPVLDLESTRVAAWLTCPNRQSTDSRRDVLAVGLAMLEPFIRSWLVSQRARADRDEAFQTRLLSEIVSTGGTIGADTAEAATSLGWRLREWHVGIHVRADDHPGWPADRSAAQVRGGLEHHGVSAVACVNRGDGYALWTSSGAEPDAGGGRGLLRLLRVITADLPPQARAVAGVGRAHHGPRGLADTLQEARDAADLAATHRFRPAVEHSDELGVAQVLAAWQRSAVTRAFAETALAPLADSPVLLETLGAYLEAGESVIDAASALGVHRNTVRTRIAQIRQRLGFDLDDPSRRLAIQVACRTWRR